MVSVNQSLCYVRIRIKRPPEIFRNAASGMSTHKKRHHRSTCTELTLMESAKPLSIHTHTLCARVSATIHCRCILCICMFCSWIACKHHSSNVRVSVFVLSQVIEQPLLVSGVIESSTRIYIMRITIPFNYFSSKFLPRNSMPASSHKDLS